MSVLAVAGKLAGNVWHNCVVARASCLARAESGNGGGRGGATADVMLRRLAPLPVEWRCVGCGFSGFFDIITPEAT